MQTSWVSKSLSSSLLSFLTTSPFFPDSYFLFFFCISICLFLSIPFCFCPFVLSPPFVPLFLFFLSLFLPLSFVASSSFCLLPSPLTPPSFWLPAPAG